ncbi:MAG: adenylate/guanylate cyclase domain-containing protein [Verrucomicrobia bacterium]|nr:adenylate/guanylate cyclase domain-containing protein [Verrucomicrobiota bacterium]
MKAKSLKLAPVLIVAATTLVVCIFQALPRFSPHADAFERLEWMTYDWRVRQAFESKPPVATNLGALFIDDEDLQIINEQMGFKWPLPRRLYGRAVERLTAEGAGAIGFDILFSELDTPRPETNLKRGGVEMSSDEYFSQQLKAAGNVTLAAFGETLGDKWTAIAPADLFRTNAFAVGHATSDTDSDGVLRRTRAFKDDPKIGRIWHLGIVLAARSLGLDLTQAVIEKGRITLRGAGGVERVIPLDHEGYFHVNWSLAWNDPRLTKGALREMLRAKSEDDPDWRGKIVVIGSIGAGNNISDIGASPLDRDTYLVSKHWNVANSVLMNDFITRSPYGLELVLILLLAAASAAVSLKLQPPWATVGVAVAGAVYVIVALLLFVKFHYWLPIILPVGGGLLLNHVSLATYQLLFEQSEKRRVKAVFSRLVSPDVVNELLGAEKLNLGGGRRHITVFFADVRGFTEMTDAMQSRAEEFVRTNKLEGAEAEAHFDASASATLATVNIYLATIADQIKKHNGTLDKYIGDCVMAFWGAPVPNDNHAAACVRAAVDAQRAMHRLNLERAEENKRIENENQGRALYGKPPQALLPLLSLGTGINSGVAIVGLMGSNEHILNYTVFGREVNLASRLEGVSGRGRIIIGESTYQELLKHAPELAATCVPQAPVMVKGIKAAVNIYEVPWRESAPAAGPAHPAEVEGTMFLRNRT